MKHTERPLNSTYITATKWRDSISLNPQSKDQPLRNNKYGVVRCWSYELEWSRNVKIRKLHHFIVSKQLIIKF